MKCNQALLWLLMGCGLVACSDDKKPLGLTDGSHASTTATRPLTNGVNPNTQGLANAGHLSGNNDLLAVNSPQSKVIYFSLDSSEIQADYLPVVKAHAQYLVANPNVHVVLEGNTDERGSREYNIALGEQRAKAVATLLLAQGASDNQVQLVSYGEEKPAADGSDETAWQQNRRVEITYQR